MTPGTRVWVPEFKAWATIGEELPKRLCAGGEPHWRLVEFGAFAKRSEFTVPCHYCGCTEEPFTRSPDSWPSCPQCNAV